MRKLRSLFIGDFGVLLVAAQIMAGALIVAGCYDAEEISPVTTTSVSNGGSTSAGGATATGGMTASGGATSTAGAGGESTGGTSSGGVGGVGGATGTGGMVAQIVPDFSLIDLNTASPTSGQAVSPRDYLGKVSAWYFGHST